MNTTHERMLNDEKEVERPIPDWNKAEKLTREMLEATLRMEKGFDKIKEDYDFVLRNLPKVYMLIPETDELYSNSPLRQEAFKLAVKLHMKRIGFTFISAGQPTLADVTLKSLTESFKEATRWIFKFKTKE